MSTRSVRGEVTDSEEEALVRATAAAVVAGHPVGTTGAWSELSELGLTQLRHPEPDGTPGAPTSTALIVVEETGRRLSAAPFASASAMAPEILRLAGVGPERASALCAGTGLAVTLRSDLTRLADVSDHDSVVWDSGDAASALAVRDGELVIVEVGDRVPSADETRHLSTPGAVREHLGLNLRADQYESATAFARLVVAADALGVAGALFDSAVDYAGERVQYGVAIGSFQAVQHLLAAGHVQLETLRSSILYSAWLLDGTDHAAAAHAAKVAKSYSATVTTDVVDIATQVFGGIAITWEHDAHRHLRRAWLDRLVLGDESALHQELAREID